MAGVFKKPSLHVFDFDDTLFTTDNRVTIHVSGKGIYHLTSEEYAQLEKHGFLPRYHISPGDDFYATFENFEKVSNPRPIHRNLRIFQNILKYSPANLYILTARGGEENRLAIKQAVDEYFLDMLPAGGFPLNHIITREHQASHPGANTAHKKRHTIENLMKTKNIDRVHFLDDAPANVESVKQIPGSRARLVKPEENPAQNSKEILGATMPRKNVPHEVDEIADAIMARMRKDKKNMSEDRMYDIAYGTAWSQYKKKHPEYKKKSSATSVLKLAQYLDDLGYYDLADGVE